MLSLKGAWEGHFFFLLYINDMKASCSTDLFLHVDDLAALVSHKDLAVVEKCLSEELQNVGTWLSDNKLSLHLGKIEAIFFASWIKLGNTPEAKIKVGHSELFDVH